MSDSEAIDAGIAIPIVFVVLGCPCLLLLACYALDRLLVHFGGTPGCALHRTLRMWCCLRDDASQRTQWNRDADGLPTNRPNLPSGSAQPGIDEYEGVTPFDGVEGVCAVCLEFLKDQTSWELHCGHAFHRLCIVGWLAKKRTCPVCRKAQYLHVNPVCEA